MPMAATSPVASQRQDRSLAARNLILRIAGGLVVGAISAPLTLSSTHEAVLIPTAFLIAGCCGALFRPTALLGFVPAYTAGMLIADARYEPPLGTSGIDAMGPGFALPFLLPLLCLTLTAGWLLQRRIARREQRNANA
jgi:hypothetical protein